MNQKLQKLVDSARAAQKKAYAPYSRFKVGAAVLTKSGKIFSGANVENASYGLSICAERVAVSQAVSSGDKEILVVAVFSSSTQPASPCGACRQFIAEFGNEIMVVMANAKGRKFTKIISQLLPDKFQFKRSQPRKK